jgi:pantoate--beta-alanine ligase
MKVVKTIDELRAALGPLRRAGRSIGFVATMGALHEGHLSLLKIAHQRCDVVVMSVFVNPLQFGPQEDYRNYPRDEARDLVMAEAWGCHVAFLPTVDEMYPTGHSVEVSAGPLGEILEGADRPGHFDGVCTVVAKLFNIVQPDVAVFGQKDAQQVAVVKRMVTDLGWPIEIVVGPTVREPDGVAMSSRNAYLSDPERRHAEALHRALQAGRDALAGGEGIIGLEKKMMEVLTTAEGVVPSYARAVDPDSFQAPRPDGQVLLAVAARVGPARLIDNVLIEAR